MKTKNASNVNLQGQITRKNETKRSAWVSKTLFLFMSLALILVTSISAQAQTNSNTPSTDVQLTAKNQIRVWYLDAHNEKVNIRIYNSKDELVDQYQFKCEGNFKVIFDVRKLASDNYTVKVFNNKTLIRAELVTLNQNRLCSIPVPINENEQNLANNGLEK